MSNKGSEDPKVQMKIFRTSRLQKIVKVLQVHVIDEVAKETRSMRRQVPMIQDETRFSPYLTSRSDKVQTTTRDSR